jgi:protein-disulfide isomerase
MKMALAPFANGIVSASALIALGVLLGRGNDTASRRVPEPAPLARADWQALLRDAPAMGSPAAPHSVVVFSDFQCPYCATFAATMRALQQNQPGRARLFFHHFPLESIHPHARLAAVAAECARVQGRFEAYHDALFADQENIGVRDWNSFAASAAVPDTAAFAACISNEATAERVTRDVITGDRLGVDGTPTIYVDGKLLDGAPTLLRLEALIR